MIIGRRAFWCQCPLARDVSLIGKHKFVAHCNEGKSMLRAIGGHLNKKVLVRTCWIRIMVG